MTTPPAGAVTSRRSLIAGAGLGLLAGGAWVAGLRAVATPSRPRLAVIGTGVAQIALLDTSGARVLIMSGIPDDQLLEQVPALMTLFRQRVDILIGSPMTLDTVGRAFRDRWNVSIIAPVGTSSLARPRAPHEHPISSTTDLELADDVSIRVKVTPRNGWTNSDTGTSLWIAELATPTYRIVIAPDAGSLRVLAEPGPVLACIPEGNAAAIYRQVRPASIAMNDSSNGVELRNDDPRPTIVRTYPADIAVFDFQANGLSMPSWAETPG